MTPDFSWEAKMHNNSNDDKDNELALFWRKVLKGKKKVNSKTDLYIYDHIII